MRALKLVFVIFEKKSKMYIEMLKKISTSPSTYCVFYKNYKS